MKTIVAISMVSVILIVSFEARAQDSNSNSIFAYATYFVCTTAGESRADEIISSSFKPHYDQAVEQGQILSWTWLQHYLGGDWRRVLVVVTNDMESALEMSGALGEIISDSTPEAGRAFSEICSSHQDYIWQSIPDIGGGPVTADRGDATFSTYLQCSLADEERADQLFKEVFSKIYDKHVADGELTSWNWFKVAVGGEWRRLLTMGALDHNSLMQARAAIQDDLKDRKLSRALREFKEICYASNDYMWDSLLETS